MLFRMGEKTNVDEELPDNLKMLLAMKRNRKGIYESTVSAAERARRRKKNKASRKARKK